jgi:hypothetical protein
MEIEKMDSQSAKNELVISNYLYALDSACLHFKNLGDLEGLLDIRRAAETAVDAALQRLRPFRKLQQEVIVDPETGRQIG